MLTVYPNINNNNQFSSSSNKINAANQSSSLMNIKKTDTSSLKNTDQLMIVLNDHRSPIKVCISSDSNPELNNNSIVHLKELSNDQLSKLANNKQQFKNHHHQLNDELDLKENLKQSKNYHTKQKKFAVAAKQLNKTMSTSQSFSSVCLKNINIK